MAHLPRRRWAGAGLDAVGLPIDGHRDRHRHRSASAARRARPVRARAIRAAVGDPSLLRHRGDDGRRHQPRGGGARLRHPAGHRRGRRREPARGTDPLHLELRDGRAAARAVAPSRRPLRRPLRPPAGEIIVTIGVSEALMLATHAASSTPATRSSPPTPTTSPYPPCGRSSPAASSSQFHPRRREHDFRVSRPRTWRAHVHRAHEGHPPRLPVQPDGRGQMTREDLAAIADVAARRDLIVISDEIYDRLSYGIEHTCFARASRHEEFAPSSSAASPRPTP